MKRFWLALAVLVFLIGSLSACGKKRPERGLSERGERAERTESARERDAGAEPESSGPSLPAGQVAVTRVIQEGEDYSITLNGVLGIRGVTIRSGSGGEFLAWPRRRDENNRYWNYIFVNRADMPAMLAAVKSGAGAAEPQGFQVTNTKVNVFENARGRRKAFVDFELNGGVVKLTSWGILAGANGPFLVPPSEKRGDDWEDVVFPVSKEFRETLQQAALAAYQEAGGSMEPMASGSSGASSN